MPDDRPRLDESKTLRRNDRSDDVRRMQEELKRRGYDVGGAGADGRFGPDTEAAVRKFQTDQGIKVDGIAGRETLGRLNGTSAGPAGGRQGAKPVVTPQATKTVPAALGQTGNTLVKRQTAEEEFRVLKKAYDAHMATYMAKVNANVPDWFTGSGSLYNMYKSAAALGHIVTQWDTNVDLSGGCIDIQRESGDVLKPYVVHSDHWEARNIRIANTSSLLSPGGFVAHNAVVVYRKGGSPIDGLVFDPWTRDSSKPGPLSTVDWLGDHSVTAFLNATKWSGAGQSPLAVGAVNDIGSSSSLEFETFNP